MAVHKVKHVYLHTEIEISAPAERVWTVLTDFPRYGDWNPFIRAVSGEARQGGRLEIDLELPGGKRMKFQPRIVRLRENKELRWLGRLLVPRLFDGEHSFVLDTTPRGSVIFTQGELFGGLMVKLSPNSLFDKTRVGFEKMNEALKKRVEEFPQASSG
jgi:hypothetical protein